MSVLISTSLGDVVIDLFIHQCPLTTKNFLKLCKIKYYNGCLFHTVQKDFTAQTGDPTGRGSGGDSVYKFLYGQQARFFMDEIHPDLKHSKAGTVSMASAGENLNASQFYFTLRDDLDYLDGKHTVFGKIEEGMETLMRINEAFVDEHGRPYKNIRIKHTYILHDPFDDPMELAELIPESSPEGKPSDEALDDVRLEDDWVPLDEQLDPAELEQTIRAKEAHSRAVVLEMIGDIPEAEAKPPENVLFVCKLNPVTKDEALEIIFARFGKVISADIIHDYKTGDSLCYAFIEFETEEACEAAYFKMDNALIDDRRIHVDFSQSVAKLWSQYRRGGKKKWSYEMVFDEDSHEKPRLDVSIKDKHEADRRRDNNVNGRSEHKRNDDVAEPGSSKRRRESKDKHNDEEYEHRRNRAGGHDDPTPRGSSNSRDEFRQKSKNGGNGDHRNRNHDDKAEHFVRKVTEEDSRHRYKDDRTVDHRNRGEKREDREGNSERSHNESKRHSDDYRERRDDDRGRRRYHKYDDRR